MGISRRIAQMTNGAFDVKAGSLFPALHHMERGWLASVSLGRVETNRRAKFYALTKTGRKQVEDRDRTMGTGIARHGSGPGKPFGGLLINRLRALCNSVFHKDQLDQDLDRNPCLCGTGIGGEGEIRDVAGEAYLHTRREMGGVDQVRQRVLDIRAGAFLERLAQDVRYGVRTLAKNPGFCLVVIATLALGIGANAAMFSVIDAVLLQPLPYIHPGQLVSLAENEPKAGVSGAGMSWPAFTLVSEHNRSFSAIAGLATHSLTLTGNGEPTEVSTVSVTANFFRVWARSRCWGAPFLRRTARKTRRRS